MRGPGIHDDDMPQECECDCMCEEGLTFASGMLVLILGLLLATLLTGGWGALYGC